jgi:hypothetical protein
MRWFLLAILGVAALVVAIVVLTPFDPIDRCLDHGARWNYDTGKCECTPEELSSPAVKPEFVAYRNEPGPAPAN